MDENEVLHDLNPEPQELRQDAITDAAKALGKDVNDELQRMAMERIEGEQPEPVDIDVNGFLEDLDTAEVRDAGKMPDVEAARKPAQPAWPAHQGVDPKEIRRRRTEREQARNRARRGLPTPPAQELPTPDTKQEREDAGQEADAPPLATPRPPEGDRREAHPAPRPAAPQPVVDVPVPDTKNKDTDHAAASPVERADPHTPQANEMPVPETKEPRREPEAHEEVRQAWNHRDKFTMPDAEIPVPDTGARPPRDPDQRDEHRAVDQALAPIGNDKDLNNQLLQAMREYFDQERAFRHSMLNIWTEALHHLRADFARLEDILAAFERDRESY